MKHRTLRVLHCPNNIAGNPGALARAERELGLRSWCVSFWEHPFGYGCDEVLWNNTNSVVRNELKRLALFWRAVRKFDVIHCNFGSSILPKRLDRLAWPGSRAKGLGRRAYNAYARVLEFRDLAILKRAGKAIFVTYQGDDARQGGFCRSHFQISPACEVEANYYSESSDTRKQREISIFAQYADGIYALNPDLMHVLPSSARFMPYAHIDLEEWTPIRGCVPKKRPLVIHAPSHRGVKGTRFILDAVSRLHGEGIAFDFVLVEGMPNDDARRVYEKADLVVDQLLLGWYGGLAVEAMALGKPVICYIREEDLRFLEADMRAQLPVIRAEPATIHEVLKVCLTTQRQRLQEIGRLGRAYVERWHDPLCIARFLREQYISALHAARGAEA